ncbi:OprO/OprP family phosphate-selective porin [Bacteroidales bacterium OttesenSCG-928-C19]|nr:OprO/OprP family phosphate-selective porin [Bacteroidales bacterium OttesenSCG-928-C19]
MRKLLLTFAFISSTFAYNALYSQDENQKRFNLSFNARGDFDMTYDDKKETLQHGFVGQNLNMMFDGKINDKFSIKVRQRFNKPISDSLSRFFNATDIMTLTYNIDSKLSIVAGKQVVALGGFEYDLAPIDLYFLSQFTNNFPSCYEFGVALNYATEKDLFGFQFINSPFAVDRNGKDGIYAYNLSWYGNHDWFNSIYSFNIMEYRKGKFVNYITLGNQFNFNDFCFEFDFQNRTVADNIELFKDFSIIGNLKYALNNHWNFFAKGGYDQNKSDVDQDVLFHEAYRVLPDTEYVFGGIGAEFFPLKEKKDIRIHAYTAITNEKSEKLLFNIGLTWRIKAI